VFPAWIQILLVMTRIPEMENEFVCGIPLLSILGLPGKKREP